MLAMVMVAWLFIPVIMLLTYNESKNAVVCYVFNVELFLHYLSVCVCVFADIWSVDGVAVSKSEESASQSKCISLIRRSPIG